MGAVSSAARGQGIYQRMRATAHEVARDKGYKRVLGELSSAATQHVVLNQLGHRKMVEILFSEFRYSETLPFASIENPPSIILSEGTL